jgi:hypothetical protein
MKRERMPINFPGITKEMEQELEARLKYFEANHEDDVIHGGPGYVPKIRNIDFIVAWGINLVLGIYWLWAVMS